MTVAHDLSKALASTIYQFRFWHLILNLCNQLVDDLQWFFCKHWIESTILGIFQKNLSIRFPYLFSILFSLSLQNGSPTQFHSLLDVENRTKASNFFSSFNKTEKSRYETSQSRCSKYVGNSFCTEKNPWKVSVEVFQMVYFSSD